MRKVDKKTQLEIIQKFYITAYDIYALLPIGHNKAREIFNEIEQELKEKGVPLFKTRPRYIPIEYLIEKYPSLLALKNEIERIERI